jgi:signal transduction histidine kinase/CheY-like chemotaxis protein
MPLNLLGIYRSFPAAVLIGLIVLNLIVSNSAYCTPDAFPTGQALELDQDFHYGSAANTASYLLDPEHTLNFSTAQSSSHWQPMQQRLPNFGFTHDTLWLRLTLHNSGPAQRYVVRLEYPLLDSIHYFYPDPSGHYQKHISGDQIPFRQRLLKDRFFSFPVDLQHNQTTTLFWRVSSRDTLIAPITVATINAYEHQQRTSLLMFGMYYGAIFVILLINSFLFFFLRQKAQLFYVGLLAAYALVELSLNGTGNMYLWGDHPEFAKVVRPVALGFLSILTVKLTQAYFELDTIRIGKTNIEPLFMAVGLVAIGSALVLPFTWSIQVAMIALVLAVPCVIIVAIHQTWLGKMSGKYYLIGWLGFFVGGLLNILRAFDLVEVNFISTYGSLIGSLFTLVILNMGLTNQFREFQRINERNKERIIRHQEQLNKQLDNAVQKRTEELQAQKQEAEKARAIAEQALDSKSRFLATMSHEIRTPMNGVLGITQILIDTPLNAHQKHLVNTIRHSGDTLVSIINDILDYSKIEAGKLNIEQIELNLRHLLDECIELFANESTVKHIRLILHVEQQVPVTILSDPTRLRQVIINLLGNAIKFTHQGYVTLKATYDPFNHSLRLAVLDTGIGISLEQQEKLFQSFSQADSSTTRKFGGTGLGLAISQSLIHLMGGRIGINSQVGQGSEFWIELPSKGHGQLTPIPALKSKRVMIFDHLPASADAICAMVGSLGMKAIINPDHHSDFNPDLIIEHDHYPHPSTTANTNACPRLRISNAQDSPPNHDNYLHEPITHQQLQQAILKQITGRERPINVDYNVKDYSILHVLVAEDNRVNQMVILGLLKKFNIIPDIANDGIEAIHAVQASSQPFDLIFMDCEMPNLDGYQATVQLLNLPQCGQTRIVGLSAHAMQEHRQSGLNAGMAAFLTKPVAIETLAEELAIALGQKTLHAANSL